jgi:hypothetical protein
VRILTDRQLADRLAAGASESAARLEGASASYAASMRRLVEQVLAR